MLTFFLGVVVGAIIGIVMVCILRSGDSRDQVLDKDAIIKAYKEGLREGRYGKRGPRPGGAE